MGLGDTGEGRRAAPRRHVRQATPVVLLDAAGGDPGPLGQRALVAKTPERRLQLAVLEDAIRTLGSPRDTRAMHEAQAEVRTWLASDAEHGPFTFVVICESLELDPAWARGMILARWTAVPGRGAPRRLTRGGWLHVDRSRRSYPLSSVPAWDGRGAFGGQLGAGSRRDRAYARRGGGGADDGTHESESVRIACGAAVGYGDADCP